MKHKFPLYIASLALVFSCGLIGGVHTNKDKIEEASAYYTPSTHYSVSDTASELTSYYSSISDSDTGSSLLNKLQTLNTSKRKRTVGYSTMGTDTGGAFIYTDYDLNNTATDSNGQKYGTKVASFYTKTASTGWNREHVWPNSHGGDKVEADILHTRPTISSENSSRGNSFYVEGKNNSSSGWDPYTAGFDIECRGECARIILYSVVAYSGFSLSDADSHSTSNSNPDYMMGNMNTLIKWHFDYPPNVYEINRNNGAEYLQGNRNPFVDHPEYAARIWSSFNSTVSTLCTNNASKYSNWTPGNYCNYGETTPVNNDGVTISSSSASISVGSTTTLSATASNSGTISWTTSNSSVASLSTSSTDSGANVTITGVAAGTVTITAKATINGTQYSKTCTVTVTKVVSSLSKGSTSPTKTTYTAGESFDPTGLTITANYSDSTSGNVTSSVVWTPDPLTAGTTSVTGTFGGKTIVISGLTVNSSGGSGGGESGSFNGTYNYGNQGTGTGKTWSLTDCSDQSSYWLCPNTGDESVALISGIFTDLTITSNVVITINSGTYGSGGNPSSSTFAIYNSSACTSQVPATQTGTLPTSKTYTDAVYTVSLANASSFSNDLAIMITKPGKQIRLVSITVEFDYETQGGSSSPTLSSISLDTTNVQTAFTVNATFNYTGLVVTAHYSDSTSATVTPTSVSTPDMSTTGNKTVTVTYQTVSNTYIITVSSAAATSITATVSKTYYVGETISSSDISVEDNNGDPVNSFTFANDGYQFTYADAASGGALTNKTFTNAVSSGNLTCSLTVQVQRKARINTLTEDKSVTYTDLPTTYQTSTTERTAASGVKFIAYNLANYSSKMQFRASGGYFRTTEAMSLQTLTINNRETNALTVYGSTNGTSFSTSITGTNDVYDLTGYTYVKVMKNGSGAAYCASITLTIGGSDSAVNLANYVMYEDTNNQCTSKFSIAKGYFEGLSTAERSTFMSSSDYVISKARERLLAWAAHEGKTITQVNGDYVVSAPVNVVLQNLSQNSAGIAIIVTVSLITAASIGGYFFLKKRKEF